ncbi:hypothetical protein AN2V17_06280 [Vallitalea sp. AN17-2]|uniref:Uncharacterized protein n=1 Tax=Vallitalea maricola TaxID=3074433 RepID=A0ACB5UEM8_9FIRM|nr:hypothetical protein AN2V17_06280 [Vallitalea sp. AN17-2]
MEMLALLEKQMQLSEQDILDFSPYYDKICAFLEKNHIQFDENFALGFYSHMYAFVGRLKIGEMVQDVDRTLEKEIEPRVMVLTKELLESVGNEYLSVVSKDEILLASIHIQTAILMQEKGE